MSTALEEGNVVRKGSAIEIQDGSGRRRTVQLDELNEADRALAEKFGYKPVSLHAAIAHMIIISRMFRN
jgi:hypothetical protein